MPDTPVFATAAVAAPHSLAAETGRAVLSEGGNAVEAMVAMAATIAVVYPHMNGIGGDGFWLVRTPDGKVVAIEACGPAGQHATIARYREKGLATIPPRGPDAAATVAGAVGGWAVALDLARSLGGRLPLTTLLSDAIRHAREGCPISASEARYRVKESDAIHEAPGFQQTYRQRDNAPERGAIRRFARLADTLEQISRAGPDDFYRGDIGREAAADLERIGSAVTRADLQAFRARMVQPLSLRLPGVTLFNFPPPTQGVASLAILGMFERLGVTRRDSFEHIHGLVEASKRALQLRDRVVTDPDRVTHDLNQVLSEAALAREAARIDMKRAAPWPLKDGEGDTIWMGAIDTDGVAVSYIQSVYWE